MTSRTRKGLALTAGVAALVIAYMFVGGNVAGGWIVLREQNSSGQSGSAQIVEINGQAFVKILLSGKLLIGVTQPANIYHGSCKNPGAYKYTLTGITGGFSETVLGGTLERLRAELPLMILVAKDDVTTSPVVCGEIKI